VPPRSPIVPQVQPDYTFISTWNEHVSQSRQLPTGTAAGGSMGLESDATSAGKGFVGEGFNTLSQTLLFFTDAGRIRLSWCVENVGEMDVKYIRVGMSVQLANVHDEAFSREVEPLEHRGVPTTRRICSQS